MSERQTAGNDGEGSGSRMRACVRVVIPLTVFLECLRLENFSSFLAFVAPPRNLTGGWGGAGGQLS